MDASRTTASVADTGLGCWLRCASYVQDTGAPHALAFLHLNEALIPKGALSRRFFKAFCCEFYEGDDRRRPGRGDKLQASQ